MILDINAFFNAAYSNDVPLLESLISKGADPNVKHPRAGTVPLQLACEGNAIAALHVLIKNGANPSLSYTRQSRVNGNWFVGHTPLMYAKSVEAAQILLDAGAVINATDGNGWTALVYAVNAKNVLLFLYLRSRGASTDVHPKVDGRQMNLRQFVECEIDFFSSLPQNDKVCESIRNLGEIRKTLISA